MIVIIISLTFAPFLFLILLLMVSQHRQHTWKHQGSSSSLQNKTFANIQSSQSTAMAVWSQFHRYLMVSEAMYCCLVSVTCQLQEVTEYTDRKSSFKNLVQDLLLCGSFIDGVCVSCSSCTFQAGFDTVKTVK